MLRDYKEQTSNFFFKYWYVLLAIGLLGLVIGFINLYLGIEENRKVTQKYPYYKSSIPISGIIADIDKSINRSGDGIEFMLENGKGYTLGWANNYNYTPNKLSDFLQVSDSIYKKSDTDSILIYRNEEVYEFVISERLNEGKQ